MSDIMYLYGMRLRGFSIGCQPKEGFEEAREDKNYWNVLVYNRELTKEEVKQYDLDYLGIEGTVN